LTSNFFSCSPRHGIPEEKYFTKQLSQVKNLLKKQHPPSDEEVVNILGHSVNALYSVPTALYCFLRNSKGTAGNPLTQTLEYAISLGGDTDTIASMACALSGSFYGDVLISENLRKHCEGFEEFVALADQLLAAANQ
jgi:poly(ADP-ribose) glycohydrolase ARH3